MPDLSYVLSLLWQSALLPFVVTVTVLLLVRQATVALVAGFLASYFVVFHVQWKWVPGQSLDMLPWIALLGGAAAVWRASMRGVAAHLAVPLIVAISYAATGWFAIAGLGLEKVLSVVAAGTVLASGVWRGLTRTDGSSAMAAPLLMLVAAGAALALVLDSSQSLGQLTGALAATCGALIVLRAAGRGRYSDSAVAGVAILLLGALLSSAYLYAGFPLTYIALLLAAFLAEPLVTVFQKRNGRGSEHHSNGSRIVIMGLAAAPVLITVVLAVKAAQEMGGY